MRLLPTESTITAFGNGHIKPLGQTSVEVVVKKQKYVLYCEVADGNVPNLLVAKYSERLGLVKRVYRGNKSSGCVVKQNYGFVLDNNANAYSNTASTDTSNECTEKKRQTLV